MIGTGWSDGHWDRVLGQSIGMENWGGQWDECDCLGMDDLWYKGTLAGFGMLE